MAKTALTRRGRTVLGICFVAVVMAVLFGSRSLNVVVVPGVIGLVAGYYQLSRLETPEVRRDIPPNDFVGSTHTVRLTFTDPDSRSEEYGIPFLATIDDRLSDGLSMHSDPIQTTVGSGPTEYTIEYTGRGEHQLGPLSVTATDILGLFERQLRILSTDSLLVYPERRPVPVWLRRTLYQNEALGASRQREEFDRLREYARGDALQDIHWSATAKQEELIVKEFAAESEQGHVTIAGGTSVGPAASDRLAEAITSIALALLEDGVPVVVSVPDGVVKADPSHSDRRQLLELLALMSAGTLSDSEADVTLETRREATTVRTDFSRYRFADLVDAVEQNDSESAVSRPNTAGNQDDVSAMTDGGTTAQIDHPGVGSGGTRNQQTQRQQSRPTGQGPPPDGFKPQMTEGEPTPDAGSDTLTRDHAAESDLKSVSCCARLRLLSKGTQGEDE